MRGFKLSFFRLFFVVSFIWSKLWSKVYNFFSGMNKYKKMVTLPTDLTPANAQQELSKLTWAADTWKQLWHVVAPAAWTQYCIEAIKQVRKQPKGPLDCDEFAAWGHHCMDNKYSPRSLYVYWLDASGKLQGHAVCVYMVWHASDKIFKYGHIGNWGHFGATTGFSELVENMVGPDADVIGWGVLDADLDIIIKGRGLPSPDVDLAIV